MTARSKRERSLRWVLLWRHVHRALSSTGDPHAAVQAELARRRGWDDGLKDVIEATGHDRP